MQSESSAVRFYEGKVIFVTGATGFLGKVLVSKLLSSCPGLGILYVLIRGKKEKDVKRRLEDFLNDSVFDQVRKINPTTLNKIIPIAGDISQPQLGFSEDDWITVTNKVSIIFHVAATIKFIEPLKTAIRINVRGTQEVKEMATKCKNLVSAVFVGTAYSQFPMNEVLEEKFYKPPMKAVDAMKMVDNFTLEKIEENKNKLLQNVPNTYTYTKAISEEIISSVSGTIPCCLFRPSIITGAVEEPSPGWISTGGTIPLITIGVAKGLLKVIPADANIDAGLVPVDYVANAIIVAGYKTALLGKHAGVRIYNYVPSPKNPVTWKTWQKAHTALKSYKSTKQTTFRMESNKFYFKLLIFLLHTFPALIKDIFLIITFQKPKFFKETVFYNVSVQVASPFGWNELKSNNKNIQELWNGISEGDKKLFPFNMETVMWKKYLQHHVHGIVRYLLKW